MIYTDGSVLDNGYTGSGFTIPDLKITKSFHIGYGFSVFTAELLTIIMALNEIIYLIGSIANITL